MADNTLPRPNSPGVTPQPSVAGVQPVSPYIGQGQRVTPPAAMPMSTTPVQTPAMNPPTSAWKPGGSPQTPFSAAKPVTPISTFKPSAPVAGAAVVGAAVGATAASSMRPGAPTPPPPGSPAKPMTPPPKPVEPKKSVLRFLPFLLLALVILGIAGYAAYWFLVKNKAQPDNGTPTTGSDTSPKKKIVYWGLWEPTTVMQEVLSDFEKANPGYQVEYVQQSHKQYRERLQAEIAKGTGPDVFRFHDSWVPMLRNELSPLPEKIMTKQEFSQTFYPVAEKSLTLNGNIVGLPMMYDGLGLYYNKDIFTVANRTPPKTWEEMKTVASDLTIRSGTKITRGGAALGTASNVEHFSEIVALLMLQNGADPADPTTPQAIEALRFYTDFAEKLKVWDATLPNSTVAFAKGDVAMMIAPSWRVHEIKAQNPNLQFDILPVPQLPDKERITWASFWVEGVSEKSKDKEAAWKLVKYLSSAEVEKKLYSDASTVRAFGELYSRKDLADEIASKPYVGAYIQDAPFAKTWYLNAYTHDNGINDRIIKYYQDAINKGQGSLATSAATIKLGIDQVLKDFGVVSSAQK